MSKQDEPDEPDTDSCPGTHEITAKLHSRSDSIHDITHDGEPTDKISCGKPDDEKSGRNGNVSDKHIAVDKKQEKLQEKERKSLRRNKSIGGFRRIFQKHHSRSVSEGIGRQLSPSFAANTSRQTKSDNLQDGAISPVSPGPDEVFQESDEPSESSKGRISSNPNICTAHPPLRHTNTLPALYRYSRSSSNESSGSKSSGARLWRKLGSFSFSRQLSPSGRPEINCLSPENKVDSVYQVLKEGIVLRSRKESFSSTSGSLNRNQSIDSCSSTSQNEIVHSSCSSPSFSVTKHSICHQLSDPTCTTSSSLCQNPKRGASSEESLNKSGIDSEFCSPSPDHRLSFKKKSRSPSPLLKVNEEPNSLDNERQLHMKQLKAMQFDQLAEEGNLCVALYKYDAQQSDDLSLRVGDRIRTVDDKDEKWWMGECDNKTGFFPANFVMNILPSEYVYACTRATTLKDFKNKEIQLKRNQVVAVRADWPVSDHNYIYTRCPSAEGYVHKEDLVPL